LSAAKQVINFDADFELPQTPIAVTAIIGKNERQRLGQMRSDAMNHLLLDARLADKPNAALGEVAHSAMQQPARAPAGAESKIMLLDEAHPQTAHGRIARNSGADNAATNDQDIQR
jgi:hypothetical protein